MAPCGLTVTSWLALGPERSGPPGGWQQPWSSTREVSIPCLPHPRQRTVLSPAGVRWCVQQMYAAEGLRGFYRGLGSRVLWISFIASPPHWTPIMGHCQGNVKHHIFFCSPPSDNFLKSFRLQAVKVFFFSSKCLKIYAVLSLQKKICFHSTECTNHN